jgi:ribosomal protein S18 acetylase RimI-like enzyme
MDTVIQPLQTKDYRSAKDIFHDAFDCHDLPVKDFGDSWRARSIPDSYGIFSTDGDLIGIAIVSFHKKNGTNRYLDYLAVHSAFRGRDLGSKLLCYLIDICKDQGTGIHLFPVENPRVKAWYKSHGFRETANGYYNQHFYMTRSSIIGKVQEESSANKIV